MRSMITAEDHVLLSQIDGHSRMMAYCFIHPWFKVDDCIQKLGGLDRIETIEGLGLGLWGEAW
ncbi:MAG: hypothetical protein MUQ10_11880 [Anaerolineae bacterium]|nr:hypothetical protein [Anaerolineae bacterium]